MIVIIDYEMGNIGSIFNMVRKAGFNPVISSRTEEIVKASKLILPGVGPFDKGLEKLEKLNLIPLLTDRVIGARVPFLGICLGMQVLFKKSVEGNRPGLGWIDGETIRFDFKNKSSAPKVPNMGWNEINTAKDSFLFPNTNEMQRFYFLHSYHVLCNQPADILAEAFHGYKFVAAVQRENIIGVQFHPEKSHKFGIAFFKNFLELDG